MNREPCRVSDDPSFDYSDFIEQKGYYTPRPELTEFEEMFDLNKSIVLTGITTEIEHFFDDSK